MSRLFLHVGHEKTGSSWIQSSLRLSRARLAAAGIDYPVSPRESRPTPDVAISAGNAVQVLRSLGSLHRRLSRCSVRGRSLLLSSEFMFHYLGVRVKVEDLVAMARDHGYERVAVLLFIRDPIGHLSSLWQQWVGAYGHTQDLAAFYENFPGRVARLMETVATTDGIELSVQNYSRCGDRLLMILERWLGLGDGALLTPGVERVNRSWTVAELEFMLALNRHHRAPSRGFARMLRERLPHVEPDRIRPALDVQKEWWERLRPDVERVNRQLPAEHRYMADLVEPSVSSDELRLSREQIDVIAEWSAQSMLPAPGQGLGRWCAAALRRISRMRRP
jgi:hypothetical protein